MIRGFSAIGLVNSKTEPNIGGALRAAHCYGAALVAIQGARYGKQSSDTTKMARHVPLVHVTSLLDVIPYDCIPIAVEFIPTATPLPRFSHPERAMYIFGPEDGSVPNVILERCKHVLYIPTSYCMNLASTVNVVLYDRLVKRNDYAHYPLETLGLAHNKTTHGPELLVHS